MSSSSKPKAGTWDIPMDVYVNLQAMFMERIGRKKFNKLPITTTFPIGDDVWQLGWAPDRQGFRVSHLIGYQKKLAIDGGELRKVAERLQEVKQDCLIVIKLVKDAKREKREAEEQQFVPDAPEIKLRELRERSNALHEEREKLQAKFDELDGFKMEVVTKIIDTDFLAEMAEQGVSVKVRPDGPGIPTVQEVVAELTNLPTEVSTE